ncbi:TPA: hypothetical protein SAO52_003678 [Burkholderia vietnamiensis]|nr:hypothetical protein [Burkholderia vietnamiensis]
MRLLVRMELQLRHLVFAKREPYEEFECVVVRLHKPIVYVRGRPSFIHVDVDLPDRYAALSSPRQRNADGTYRVEALLKHNRKSLAPFLASNDAYWNMEERN